MIKYLFILISVVVENRAFLTTSTAVGLTPKSPVLMRLLQTVDAATTDERLLDVSLQLLKSLCVCMRETLKAKQLESASFSGDTNSLQAEDNLKDPNKKVLDIYQNIYNKTCFDLKNEVASKVNKSANISLEEEKEFILKSDCGKTRIHNNFHTTQKQENGNKSYSSLEDILYQTFVKTRNYHKFSVRKYSLYKHTQKKARVPVKHNIIVILTLYPVNNSNPLINNSTNLDNTLNNTLNTHSPIDIDVIDARYGHVDNVSEESFMPKDASDCALKSIYTFLLQSEKNGKTTVFKLMHRNNTIKVYIDVTSEPYHSDYTKICCNDKTDMPLCKIDFSNDYFVSKDITTTTSNAAKSENFKDTIFKIKSLVKLYDKKLKKKKLKRTTELIFIKQHKVKSNVVSRNHNDKYTKKIESVKNSEFDPLKPALKPYGLQNFISSKEIWMNRVDDEPQHETNEEWKSSMPQITIPYKDVTDPLKRVSAENGRITNNEPMRYINSLTNSEANSKIATPTEILYFQEKKNKAEDTHSKPTTNQIKRTTNLTHLQGDNRTERSLEYTKKANYNQVSTFPTDKDILNRNSAQSSGYRDIISTIANSPIENTLEIVVTANNQQKKIVFDDLFADPNLNVVDQKLLTGDEVTTNKNGKLLKPSGNSTAKTTLFSICISLSKNTHHKKHKDDQFAKAQTTNSDSNLSIDDPKNDTDTLCTRNSGLGSKESNITESPLTTKELETGSQKDNVTQELVIGHIVKHDSEARNMNLSSITAGNLSTLHVKSGFNLPAPNTTNKYNDIIVSDLPQPKLYDSTPYNLHDEGNRITNHFSVGLETFATGTITVSDLDYSLTTNQVNDTFTLSNTGIERNFTVVDQSQRDVTFSSNITTVRNYLNELTPEIINNISYITSTETRTKNVSSITTEYLSTSKENSFNEFNLPTSNTTNTYNAITASDLTQPELYESTSYKLHDEGNRITIDNPKNAYTLNQNYLGSFFNMTELSITKKPETGSREDNLNKKLKIIHTMKHDLEARNINLASVTTEKSSKLQVKSHDDFNSPSENTTNNYNADIVSNLPQPEINKSNSHIEGDLMTNIYNEGLKTHTKSDITASDIDNSLTAYQVTEIFTLGNKFVNDNTTVTLSTVYNKHAEIKGNNTIVDKLQEAILDYVEKGESWKSDINTDAILQTTLNASIGKTSHGTQKIFMHENKTKTMKNYVEGLTPEITKSLSYETYTDAPTRHKNISSTTKEALSTLQAKIYNDINLSISNTTNSYNAVTDSDLRQTGLYDPAMYSLNDEGNSITNHYTIRLSSYTNNVAKGEITTSNIDYSLSANPLNDDILNNKSTINNITTTSSEISKSYTEIEPSFTLVDQSKETTLDYAEEREAWQEYFNSNAGIQTTLSEAIKKTSLGLQQVYTQGNTSNSRTKDYKIKTEKDVTVKNPPHETLPEYTDKQDHWKNDKTTIKNLFESTLHQKAIRFAPIITAVKNYSQGLTPETIDKFSNMTSKEERNRNESSTITEKLSTLQEEHYGDLNLLPSSTTHMHNAVTASDLTQPELYDTTPFTSYNIANNEPNNATDILFTFKVTNSGLYSKESNITESPNTTKEFESGSQQDNVVPEVLNLNLSSITTDIISPLTEKNSSTTTTYNTIIASVQTQPELNESTTYSLHDDNNRTTSHYSDMLENYTQKYVKGEITIINHLLSTNQIKDMLTFNNNSTNTEPSPTVYSNDMRTERNFAVVDQSQNTIPDYAEKREDWNNYLHANRSTETILREEISKTSLSTQQVYAQDNSRHESNTKTYKDVTFTNTPHKTMPNYMSKQDQWKNEKKTNNFVTMHHFLKSTVNQEDKKFAPTMTIVENDLEGRTPEIINDLSYYTTSTDARNNTLPTITSEKLTLQAKSYNDFNLPTSNTVTASDLTQTEFYKSTSYNLHHEYNRITNSSVGFETYANNYTKGEITTSNIDNSLSANSVNDYILNNISTSSSITDTSHHNSSHKTLPDYMDQHDQWEGNKTKKYIFNSTLHEEEKKIAPKITTVNDSQELTPEIINNISDMTSTEAQNTNVISITTEKLSTLQEKNNSDFNLPTSSIMNMYHDVTVRDQSQPKLYNDVLETKTYTQGEITTSNLINLLTNPFSDIYTNNNNNYTNTEPSSSAVYSKGIETERILTVADQLQEPIEDYTKTKSEKDVTVTNTSLKLQTNDMDKLEHRGNDNTTNNLVTIQNYLKSTPYEEKNKLVSNKTTKALTQKNINYFLNLISTETQNENVSSITTEKLRTLQAQPYSDIDLTTLYTTNRDHAVIVSDLTQPELYESTSYNLHNDGNRMTYPYSVGLESYTNNYTKGEKTTSNIDNALGAKQYNDKSNRNYIMETTSIVYGSHTERERNLTAVDQLQETRPDYAEQGASKNYFNENRSTESTLSEANDKTTHGILQVYAQDNKPNNSMRNNKIKTEEGVTNPPHKSLPDNIGKQNQWEKNKSRNNFVTIPHFLKSTLHREDIHFASHVTTVNNNSIEGHTPEIMGNLFYLTSTDNYPINKYSDQFVTIVSNGNNIETNKTQSTAGTQACTTLPSVAKTSNNLSSNQVPPIITFTMQKTTSPETIKLSQELENGMQTDIPYQLEKEINIENHTKLELENTKQTIAVFDSKFENSTILPIASIGIIEDAANKYNNIDNTSIEDIGTVTMALGKKIKEKINVDNKHYKPKPSENIKTSYNTTLLPYHSASTETRGTHFYSENGTGDNQMLNIVTQSKLNGLLIQLVNNSLLSTTTKIIYLPISDASNATDTSHENLVNEKEEKLYTKKILSTLYVSRTEPTRITTRLTRGSPKYSENTSVKSNGLNTIQTGSNDFHTNLSHSSKTKEVLQNTDEYNQNKTVTKKILIPVTRYNWEEMNSVTQNIKDPLFEDLKYSETYNINSDFDKTSDAPYQTLTSQYEVGVGPFNEAVSSTINLQTDRTQTRITTKMTNNSKIGYLKFLNITTLNTYNDLDDESNMVFDDSIYKNVIDSSYVTSKSTDINDFDPNVRYITRDISHKITQSVTPKLGDTRVGFLNHTVNHSTLPITNTDERDNYTHGGLSNLPRADAIKADSKLNEIFKEMTDGTYKYFSKKPRKKVTKNKYDSSKSNKGVSAHRIPEQIKSTFVNVFDVDSNLNDTTEAIILSTSLNNNNQNISATLLDSANPLSINSSLTETLKLFTSPTIFLSTTSVSEPRLNEVLGNIPYTTNNYFKMINDRQKTQKFTDSIIDVDQQHTDILDVDSSYTTKPYTLKQRENNTDNTRVSEKSQIYIDEIEVFTGKETAKSKSVSNYILYTNSTHSDKSKQLTKPYQNQLETTVQYQLNNTKILNVDSALKVITTATKSTNDSEITTLNSIANKFYKTPNTFIFSDTSHTTPYPIRQVKSEIFQPKDISNNDSIKTSTAHPNINYFTTGVFKPTKVSHFTPLSAIYTQSQHDISTEKINISVADRDVINENKTTRNEIVALQNASNTVLPVMNEKSKYVHYSFFSVTDNNYVVPITKTGLDINNSRVDDLTYTVTKDHGGVLPQINETIFVLSTITVPTKNESYYNKSHTISENDSVTEIPFTKYMKSTVYINTTLVTSTSIANVNNVSISNAFGNVLYTKKPYFGKDFKNSIKITGINGNVKTLELIKEDSKSINLPITKKGPTVTSSIISIKHDTRIANDSNNLLQNNFIFTKSFYPAQNDTVTVKLFPDNIYSTLNNDNSVVSQSTISAKESNVSILNKHKYSSRDALDSNPNLNNISENESYKTQSHSIQNKINNVEITSVIYNLNYPEFTKDSTELSITPYSKSDFIELRDTGKITYNLNNGNKSNSLSIMPPLSDKLTTPVVSQQYLNKYDLLQSTKPYRDREFKTTDVAPQEDVKVYVLNTQNIITHITTLAPSNHASKGKSQSTRTFTSMLNDSSKTYGQDKIGLVTESLLYRNTDQTTDEAQTSLRFDSFNSQQVTTVKRDQTKLLPSFVDMSVGNMIKTIKNILNNERKSKSSTDKETNSTLPSDVSKTNYKPKNTTMIPFLHTASNILKSNKYIITNLDGVQSINDLKLPNLMSSTLLTQLDVYSIRDNKTDNVDKLLKANKKSKNNSSFRSNADSNNILKNEVNTTKFIIQPSSINTSDIISHNDLNNETVSDKPDLYQTNNGQNNDRHDILKLNSMKSLHSDVIDKTTTKSFLTRLPTSSDNTNYTDKLNTNRENKIPITYKLSSNNTISTLKLHKETLRPPDIMTYDTTTQSSDMTKTISEVTNDNFKNPIITKPTITYNDIFYEDYTKKPMTKLTTYTSPILTATATYRTKKTIKHMLKNNSLVMTKKPEVNIGKLPNQLLKTSRDQIVYMTISPDVKSFQVYNASKNAKKPSINVSIKSNTDSILLTTKTPKLLLAPNILDNAVKKENYENKFKSANDIQKISYTQTPFTDFITNKTRPLISTVSTNTETDTYNTGINIQKDINNSLPTITKINTRQVWLQDNVLTFEYENTQPYSKNPREHYIDDTKSTYTISDDGSSIEKTDHYVIKNITQLGKYSKSNSVSTVNTDTGSWQHKNAFVPEYRVTRPFSLNPKYSTENTKNLFTLSVYKSRIIDVNQNDAPTNIPKHFFTNYVSEESPADTKPYSLDVTINDIDNNDNYVKINPLLSGNTVKINKVSKIGKNLSRNPNITNLPIRNKIKSNMEEHVGAREFSIPLERFNTHVIQPRISTTTANFSIYRSTEKYYKTKIKKLTENGTKSQVEAYVEKHKSQNNKMNVKINQISTVDKDSYKYSPIGYFSGNWIQSTTPYLHPKQKETYDLPIHHKNQSNIIGAREFSTPPNQSTNHITQSQISTTTEKNSIPRTTQRYDTPITKKEHLPTYEIGRDSYVSFTLSYNTTNLLDNLSKIKALTLKTDKDLTKTTDKAFRNTFYINDSSQKAVLYTSANITDTDKNNMTLPNESKLLSSRISTVTVSNAPYKYDLNNKSFNTMITESTTSNSNAKHISFIMNKSDPFTDKISKLNNKLEYTAAKAADHIRIKSNVSHIGKNNINKINKTAMKATGKIFNLSKKLRKISNATTNSVADTKYKNTPKTISIKNKILSIHDLSNDHNITTLVEQNIVIKNNKSLIKYSGRKKNQKDTNNFDNQFKNQDSNDLLTKTIFITRRVMTDSGTEGAISRNVIKPKIIHRTNLSKFINVIRVPTYNNNNKPSGVNISENPFIKFIHSNQSTHILETTNLIQFDTRRATNRPSYFELQTRGTNKNINNRVPKSKPIHSTTKSIIYNTYKALTEEELTLPPDVKKIITTYSTIYTKKIDGLKSLLKVSKPQAKPMRFDLKSKLLLKPKSLKQLNNQPNNNKNKTNDFLVDDTLHHFTNNTQLHPIEKFPIETQWKLFNQINPSRRRPIMMMNTDDFLSFRRSATRKTFYDTLNRNPFPVTRNFNQFPRVTHLPRRVMLKPKFHSFENFNMNPVVQSIPKDIIMQDDRNLLGNNFNVPHKSGQSRRDMVSEVRAKLEPLRRSTPQKSHKSTFEPVIDVPYYMPTLMKTYFLRDKVESVRSYIYNEEKNQLNGRRHFKSPPKIENSGVPVDASDSQDHMYFSSGRSHERTGVPMPTRVNRPKKTIFFLSPTVPYNRYF